MIKFPFAYVYKASILRLSNRHNFELINHTGMLDLGFLFTVGHAKRRAGPPCLLMYRLDIHFSSSQSFWKQHCFIYIRDTCVG